MELTILQGRMPLLPPIYPMFTLQNHFWVLPENPGAKLVGVANVAYAYGRRSAATMPATPAERKFQTYQGGFFSTQQSPVWRPLVYVNAG